MLGGEGVETPGHLVHPLRKPASALGVQISILIELPYIHCDQPVCLVGHAISPHLLLAGLEGSYLGRSQPLIQDEDPPTQQSHPQ